jgi:hypothetical protein
VCPACVCACVCVCVPACVRGNDQRAYAHAYKVAVCVTQRGYCPLTHIFPFLTYDFVFQPYWSACCGCVRVCVCVWLQSSWVEVQSDTFVKWVNSELRQVKGFEGRVEDLAKDFQSGVILIELVSGCGWYWYCCVSGIGIGARGHMMGVGGLDRAVQWPMICGL